MPIIKTILHSILIGIYKWYSLDYFVGIFISNLMPLYFKSPVGETMLQRCESICPAFNWINYELQISVIKYVYNHMVLAFSYGMKTQGLYVRPDNFHLLKRKYIGVWETVVSYEVDGVMVLKDLK